ncbi:MAG TPA: methyl-accepting chemotaxis protein [Kofleriaceae bacterium]|nr:methyl-accepting chemotaxis protein [Kofleriaceae bacterium]
MVYLPFDVIFAALIPLAVTNGVDPADTLRTLLVLWGLSAVRIVVDMLVIGRIFGPPAHWLAIAPARPDAREIREVDEALRSGPRRFTVAVMVGWLIQLFVGMMILLFVDRYTAGIAPRSLVTVGLMASAVILGSIPFVSPLMSLLVRDAARRLFEIARKAGVPLQRERSSLKLRLIVVMASAGIAGPLWMASTGYSADAARATLEARSEAAARAARLARDAMQKQSDHGALTALADAASAGGAHAWFVDDHGEPRTGNEPALSPVLHDWVRSNANTDSATTSARDAEVMARAVVPGAGIAAVVAAPIADWSSSNIVVTLIMFFLVIIAWAPMCAFFLARDVADPLDDMTRTILQVTEVGRLDEVNVIPVVQSDEIGELAQRFNALVDTMRDLSKAATALARGDLEVKLKGEGDVATAFRQMIDSLGKIVRQIHETSVLLAAAATEIYAASQEQEAAAASQSTAMVEIRQTMESLFEAAAHVSESVRGVLSNAERTLETTDRMVIRIGDLTTHAGRIGEILETIRDISDRSDLLALNGALEASRAGEAGRGFGLVAAEMRRLAERVMSSVHDVRSLVGDIRASGSSTMMATEDSKKLAASTTDAARQITLVTQQQRSGTEQVLQSVREIAETLTQSVAAMAQTRASAEQLKSQADKLSSLVLAFRIENTQT